MILSINGGFVQRRFKYPRLALTDLLRLAQCPFIPYITLDNLNFDTTD